VHLSCSERRCDNWMVLAHRLGRNTCHCIGCVLSIRGFGLCCVSLGFEMVRSPSIVPDLNRDVLEVARSEGQSDIQDSEFETSLPGSPAHDLSGGAWGVGTAQRLLRSRPAQLLQNFGLWPVRRYAVKIGTRVGTCTALLLLLLWPAIYNGQPLFSPDTGAYIRGFDAGVVWLTGRTTAWTTWASELRARRDAAHDPISEETTSFQSPAFVIAGRSVSYGGLLYFGEVLGGLWASVALQAAATLAALALTLRHLKLFSWPTFAFTAVTLGFASSLPFFTSFLLPDIFAALALLAAANLLALGHRLARWEQAFWISILAAAVVFHPSHLAIVVALLIAAIVARVLSKNVSRVGIVALTLAAGIGFASESVFALVVQKLLGVPVDRPPVVVARIVADGPGASYLSKKCPQAGLVACEFVDRLTSNSDAFLWNTSPATGIYAPAPVEKRRELGNEQLRFAAAVLGYDPVGQIIAWLNDGFQQLRMAGISEFAPAAKQAFPSLPRVHAQRMERSALWTRDFPIHLFSAMTIFATMLSLVFVWVNLIPRWNVVAADQKIFCFVILLGELLNALICGALSGPHERYQGRLTWLLPLVALLLICERWLRSKVAGGLVVSGSLAPAETTNAPLSPAALGHAKIVVDPRVP
jgi:hypothetical protein